MGVYSQIPEEGRTASQWHVIPLEVAGLDVSCLKKETYIASSQSTFDIIYPGPVRGSSNQTWLGGKRPYPAGALRHQHQKMGDPSVEEEEVTEETHDVSQEAKGCGHGSFSLSR